MSFNKIIIVGNLGRNPELRYTPQGTAVCDFSLATNERRKDQTGDSKDETTWFKVTFFGRQAEVANQYLAKGRQVYVEGRLRAREWTDKDGKVRTSLEVTGSDIQFLGMRGDDMPATSGQESASSSPAPGSYNKPAAAAKGGGGSSSYSDSSSDIDEDDIPF